MTPIGAIGLELWSMTAGIAFDNFLVADNKKAADDFAAATWEIKKDEERRADPNAVSFEMGSAGFEKGLEQLQGS